jgi:formylglycine-generating enzyme required for sulfatase activity
VPSQVFAVALPEPSSSQSISIGESVEILTLAPVILPSTIQSSRSHVIEFETATVNTQGKITVRQRGKVRYRDEDLDNHLRLEMVLIPSGRFMMGSLDSEVGRQIDENPQHQVTVAAFLMSKYPITQTQWTLVTNLPKVNLELEPYPSYFKGEKLPVESVSWHEVVEFCTRLSKITERTYRLPSEAEWEYACRANTVTPFHYGQTITTELANFNGQSVDASPPKGEYRGQTTEVGHFQFANAFGLYDMHGNVGEWCLDNWHENYNNAPSNGSAWAENGDDRYRVSRGGCWSLYAKYCRSANRSKSEPDKKSSRIGFRVVCSSSQISK